MLHNKQPVQSLGSILIMYLFFSSFILMAFVGQTNSHNRHPKHNENLAIILTICLMIRSFFLVSRVLNIIDIFVDIFILMDVRMRKLLILLGFCRFYQIRIFLVVHTLPLLTFEQAFLLNQT